MKKSEWPWLALLFALAAIFWLPLLLPGNALFLRDLSSEIIPKRAFWAGCHGLALWDRFSFFGMAYAANPQSEAFYPLNLWFLLFPVERAVGYYLVFHHLLFILTLYPALRGLGFSRNAGFVCAAGVGFGGCLVSLSLLLVLLSTFAWLPLLIIFLERAVRGKWLANSLWLGPVMLAQFLAGEVQIAAISWALALAAVVFSPRGIDRRRGLWRPVLALGFGLFWSLWLALPQIVLSRELIPLSNRGQGMDVSEALLWPFKYYALKSLLIPNYILPLNSHHLSLHWGLGFFSGFSYLFSYYLGITVAALAAAALILHRGLKARWWLVFIFFSALLLVLYFVKPEELKSWQRPVDFICWAGGLVLLFQLICALVNPARFKVWFWVALWFGGLLIAMGESLPYYRFLHAWLPGFQLFRIPDKFFLFTAFSAMILAGYGVDALSVRKLNRDKLAWLLVLTGLAAGLVLIIFPMDARELGNRYDQIVSYLMLRSALRVSALGLITAGVLLLVSGRDRAWVGLLVGLLVFLDLYLAHHRLNPTVRVDFYRPNEFLTALAEKEKGRVTPVRILTLLPDVEEMILKRVMDPVNFYTGIKNTMEPYWSLYYGLNDVRAVASFYASDYTRFMNLRANDPPSWGKLTAARAGVEYFYFRKMGFFEISGSFPRAMVFYGAVSLPDNDAISRAWSDPNFPARRTLLVQGKAGEIKPPPEPPMSDPARIEIYENEKVVVQADAKKDGWLLLLNAYYPGWKAEVDGKPVEIFRANGFFRAVRIPAGRHRVSFSYFPEIFRKSLYLSAAGLAAWLLLMAFVLARGRKGRSAAAG